MDLSMTQVTFHIMINIYLVHVTSVNVQIGAKANIMLIITTVHMKPVSIHQYYFLYIVLC